MKLSRLIAGLALALATACGSDKVTGPPVAANVTVTPGSAVTSALGLTQQYSAAVTDANGSAVTGATITWASSNTGVATVDAAGLATATGPGTATITAAVQGAFGTSTFTVNQVPTSLAIDIQPASTAAGQAFSPAVQVVVRDASGARVVLSRDAVTLTLGANPGGATLLGTRTVNAVDGVATFAGLSLDKVGTGYTLAASSGTLSGATSGTFNVAAGPAARLAVTAQPGSGQAGTAITPAVQVTVQDAFGNTVTSATTAVTVALGSNPGGTTLGGTATQNAASGVATFGDLKVLGGGTSFTLMATAPGLTSAASAAFDMVALPAVATFAAAQPTVTTGTGSMLMAVFSGGTATIDHSIGSVTSGAPIPTGTLTATTAYTLTVTNSLGTSATQLATVSVVAAPAITSLSAAQTTVTGGSGTTLTPVFSGGTGTIDNGVGPVISGSPISTGALAASTTFTLTVTNAAGTSVTSTVPVAVVTAPTITGFVTAAGTSAITITSGASASLTAYFAGGTGTIDHGVGAVTSGSPASTGALTATTTFTLTVANSAGTSASSLITVTVVPAPTITSLGAAATTISSGTNATLTPVFSGGTGTIDHGVGAVTTNSAVSTGVLATGATTFTLTVTNAAGTSVTSTVTVTAVATPAIAGFVTASGTNAITITSGTSASLTAFFAGGTGSIDHGVGTVTSGTSVSTGALTATTTFTLTVANAAGTSASSLVTVTVVAAPTITSFAAAATTVTAGTNATLTPVFAGGTGTIDHGVGAVTSNSAVSTGLTTTGTTSFTLTVTNAAGSTATASVAVTAVDRPVIKSFAAAQTSITVGGSTNLTASYSGGTGTIDGTPAPSGIPFSTGQLNGVGQSLHILVVTNAAGVSDTAIAEIDVLSIPLITSFVSGPAVVTVGTTVILNYAFTGGTGSIDNGIGAVGGTGGGIGLTDLAAGTHNFTLTVTNAAGASVRGLVSIMVVSTPSITSFTAAQGTVTTGSSTMLTAVFGGGTASIDHSVGAATSGVAVSSGGVFALTTYTLTVTNAAGTSVTATAPVATVDPPSISSFVFFPSGTNSTSITSGTSVTLVPLFSGGTATIDHGIGAVPNGGGVVLNPSVGGNIYTLTVTNAAGTSVTGTATLNVIAAPSIASFTAGKSILTSGNSTSLTPVFSGGTGSINGTPVASGIPISTSGSYGTFTLTVTNTLGATATESVDVTAVGPPIIGGFATTTPTITQGSGATLTASFFGGVGTVDHGVGAVASNVLFTTPAPAATGPTTFTLSVKNAAGDSVTDITGVVVVPPPDGALIASRQTITSGESVLLTSFLFGGTTFAFMDSVGSVSNGQPIVFGPMTATTTFTMSVVNAAGTIATRSAKVFVVPPPVITAAFTAESAATTAGTTLHLTPHFTGATTATITTTDLPPGSSLGTVTSGQSFAVTPSLGTTTYLLQVKNAADSLVTASYTVTVVDAPSITLFISDVDNVASGTPVQVGGTWTGGTGAVDHGVGSITAGSFFPAGTVTVTTTYTLTVTNSLGVTATASVTVHVI